MSGSLSHPIPIHAGGFGPRAQALAGEPRFVTPEMIRAFCIADQPEEMVEQLTDLEHRGLDAMSVILP